MLALRAIWERKANAVPYLQVEMSGVSVLSTDVESVEATLGFSLVRQGYRQLRRSDRYTRRSGRHTLISQ